MKHITIVIPTRNRCAKLTNTLNSIPRKDFIDIRIACDGDMDTYNQLSRQKKTDKHLSKVVFVHGPKGSVFCRNYLIKEVADGILYAVDDIVFDKGSIEEAFRLFNQEFPDDDGIVGFQQKGAPFSKTGVALVGQKFLQRYPEKLLFYPKYFHFACQEIERLVDTVEKQRHIFATNDKVSLLHYHPGRFKECLDETHFEVRRCRKQDRDISMDRRAKKLIWGLSDESNTS